MGATAGKPHDASINFTEVGMSFSQGENIRDTRGPCCQAAWRPLTAASIIELQCQSANG